MRQLTNSELSVISGGNDNYGYNFSFIVESTVRGAGFGLLLGILFGGTSTNNVLLITGEGAAIGAVYAAAMMVANVLDAYAFPADAPVQATLEVNS